MKKLFTGILALAMVLTSVTSLTACSNDSQTKTNDDGTTAAETTAAPAADDNALAGTYDMTVWVSELEGVKEQTQQQIAAFCEANPGIVINATVEGISEGESATQMVTSVEDGADLFCFAQDQLARLVMAGALNKLGTGAAAEVTANNDPGAVAAATVGGDLYCYPLTSDNGYFMFYDKSVIKPEHIGSLEDIIADCEAAGKMFSFQLEGSAWYNSSFFFATGCESTWTTDLDGNFVSVNDTYNSDAGLVALKGMQKLLKSTCYNNSDAHADFSAAIPSAVVVSGTWGTSIAQEALGDNFAAAELPSFTVDGKTYHLGSYSGNKLMGIKPQTDTKKTSVLQKLALYLTGEECQTQRFTSFGWGPSNVKAQATDAVKSDVALSALAAQNSYSVPQGQIHGSWWDIGKVYATSAKAATTDDELKAALEAYAASVNGLFSVSDEVKNAFTVIGDINGDGWTIDLPMEKQDDGSWITTEAYALEAGNQFKVRQGKAWDVAYGAGLENYVVETAGTYKIQLTITGETGEVTLIAQ